MTTLSRSFTCVLGLVLIVSIASVASAPKFAQAQAPIPVFETNPATLVAIGNIAGAVTLDRAKEDILDGIAWTFAKVAVQSITKSVVNWINSGYNGSPAFSQNLNRDLRQAGDAIAGAFITDVITGAFDSPFIAPLARDAVTAYYLATSEDALAIRLKYTLADFTQNSVDYMRGRNWSAGGLSGWYGITFRCENDPTCASFVTREALYNRIDAQARKYLAEFNAGRGFLSWKGECQSYKLATSFNQDPKVPLSDADECAEYDVLTPGAVVERQLGITQESPLKQLELADSVNEIVGAVVTQMVGQVLGGGGLAGLSSPGSGGGRAPIDRATDPNASGLTAGFQSTLNTERSKTEAFRQAWLDIRTEAVNAQNVCPIVSGPISLIRSNEIAETIERADQSLARADRALQELETIASLLEDAADRGVQQGAQAASTQRAYELYQNLLSRGILITSAEQKEATDERNEAVPSSLFSKMRNHVDDCN